jgi:tetratricopeptide (TPR) repeat protein
MSNQWTFRYSLQRPPEGGVVEISAAELERHLLNRLEREKDSRDDVLWALARFYGNFGQHAKALDYFRRIMESKADLESKARCVLAMGCTMEKAGNFEAAARFYREAFAMEPMNTDTWYWIHNNLGFSLNTLGRHEEGEACCRRAIQIDPNRPNGHKNLGIALAGLGRYTEAARSFVTATQVDATDGRSLKHLEDLVSRHPELQSQFARELELCRKAVQVAAEANACMEPLVHRGWKRTLFLWKMRIRMWIKRQRKNAAPDLTRR